MKRQRKQMGYLIKQILPIAGFIILSASTLHAGANLSVMAGSKYITSGDLKPGNEQPLKAVRFDIGTNVWFANIAFDYYVSTYNKMHMINTVLTEVDIKTEEIRIGLRGYYGNPLRFFLGGGVANLSMSRKYRTAKGNVNCSGSTGINFFHNGIWGEVGADYLIMKRIMIGLSASYSDGHIKCDGHKINIGGASGGIYMGLSW